ncbi:hypothetical protein PFISCL1PPCAC_11614, partial [Pristionchus fissidentatus]
KENVHRILSWLSLSDRKRVRQCSKLMKDAIEASDLVVNIFDIRFDLPGFREGPKVPDLRIALHGLGWKGELSINYANEDEIKKLMITLKMNFRRVKCDMLKIGGSRREIDFELFEKILEFVDFNSLDLRFFRLPHANVLEFALSSGRPIDFHSK